MAEDRHDCSSRAQQVAEIGMCISALVMAYWFDGWNIFDRPVPYQYMPQENEYVRDLVHDQHLNYNYFVSNSSLHILSIYLPILLQIGWSCLLLGMKQWFDEWHKIVSCTCFALALDTLVTYAIKCYVGYLRPVYYDHCVPFEDYHGCTILHKSFVHVSFPSSHSSLSFCGMTLLALFLDRTWRQYQSRRRLIEIMDRPNHCNSELNLLQTTYRERFLSLLCVMIPLAAALLVSCTRIYNNYHYPADVLTGAILGGAIAVFCHSLWFDQGRTIQITMAPLHSDADVSSEENEMKDDEEEEGMKEGL